jgi:hypothetical protein
VDDVQRIRAMTTGFRLSQAIHVVAALGVADLIEDEPVAAVDLAEQLRCDGDSLARLMRALAATDVFEEAEDGRFTHSAMSRLLRSDHPRSVRPMAVLIGQEHVWETWGTLMHSVRTGENAFVGRYGTDVWTYRNERPEQSAIFDAAMSANTAALASEFGTTYDFTNAGTVVDLGGGDGTLLLGLLGSHTHLQGVLFDQPGVIARARGVLARSPDTKAVERCRLVEGTIFGDHPDGGDVYLMRHILHDWSDTDCVAILRCCREVLTGTGVLLVIERVLEGPNEGVESKFSDLNMLVMPGGRERSEQQFAALFEEAGLRLTRRLPVVGGEWILEAERA